MFGLGATEIVVILVVALIFLGPKKLPEIAKTLGRSMREVRRTANEFTRELSIDEPSRPAPARPPRDTGPEEDPYRAVHEEEAASIAHGNVSVDEEPAPEAAPPPEPVDSESLPSESERG